MSKRDLDQQQVSMGSADIGRYDELDLFRWKNSLNDISEK